MNNYIATIGLEIHTELKTDSKMFCGCRNETFINDNKQYAIGNKPNINVCPVCLGMPGVLPVLNRQAIEWTILTGLALHCQIGHSLPRQSALLLRKSATSPRESASWTKWDRKNYFYPDLPKGYQISQYDLPLCHDGHLEINPKSQTLNSKSRLSIEDPRYKVSGQIQNPKSKIQNKKIKIRRIHLEEDTGTSKHPEGRVEVDYSLLDYNRAGVPLMELVTEPDISSAQEAKEFCQKYQLILRYLGVSDADMEKGQLRAEVNISLRPVINQKSPSTRLGTGKIPSASLRAGKNQKLGTKVEVKNLNSFKAVEKAIEYEIERQAEALESGGKVIHETRGWDDAKGKTYTMRVKETSADYRYFPEPDLPPIKIVSSIEKLEDSINIEEIKKRLPELPDEKFERYIKEYGLREADAEVIINDIEKSKYFEKCLMLDTKYKILASKIANWLINEIPDLSIEPQQLAELVEKIETGEISGKIAKEILPELKKGKKLTKIIDEEGLKVLSDKLEIEKIIDQVIKDNPEVVEKIKTGKTQVMGFLVGQVMKETKGRANPQIVNKILKEKYKI